MKLKLKLSPLEPYPVALAMLVICISTVIWLNTFKGTTFGALIALLPLLLWPFVNSVLSFRCPSPFSICTAYLAVVFQLVVWTLTICSALLGLMGLPLDLLM